MLLLSVLLEELIILIQCISIYIVESIVMYILGILVISKIYLKGVIGTTINSKKIKGDTTKLTIEDFKKNTNPTPINIACPIDVFIIPKKFCIISIPNFFEDNFKNSDILYSMLNDTDNLSANNS